MIRHNPFVTFAALLAFACATDRPRDRHEAAETASVSRYSSEAGSTPVGVIPDATIHDAQRNRDVTLTIDYPIAAGPHPLIVFSHGFGGSGRSYVGLSSHWASNGYVVIKPTHTGDANLRLVDIQPSDFRDRVADMKLVLDSLSILQQKYPELEGKIDSSKVGVAGHSLGALTAMLIGGVRTFPGGQTYADPRVKAVIAMSPQGPRASWGLTNESWANVHLPMMFMTGDRDRGIDESETPEWRRQAFELSAPGDKWLVSIAGAGHLAFTGRLGVMPEEERRVQPMIDANQNPLNPDPQAQQGRRPQAMADPVRPVSGTIKAISLAFWDTYLRADAAGREQLEKAEERHGVEVKRR